jgi:hypothetical protein
MINAPSAHAPAECANLTAEFSRRTYAYNVRVAALRAEQVPAGQNGLVCRDASYTRQRIAEMTAIVAVSDRMDAKGCYQRPIGDYNRKLIERLKETLARCQAQAAAYR